RVVDDVVREGEVGDIARVAADVADDDVRRAVGDEDVVVHGDVARARDAAQRGADQERVADAVGGVVLVPPPSADVVEDVVGNLDPPLDLRHEVVVFGEQAHASGRV